MVVDIGSLPKIRSQFSFSPHKKDDVVLGSIRGLPYFLKLPKSVVPG